MAALNVILPEGWTDISAENPGGPPTFSRDGRPDRGALQISLQAKYKRGVVPNPSEEYLVHLAESYLNRFDQASLRGRSSGACAFGIYGTVLMSATDFERIQIWILSNGRDFILATHICGEEPLEDEVEEASAIVKNVTLK